ncbi:MAG: hypothetical protein IT445_13260 [Phycisphaeraceae bacterium]|nr:hypothetical protein [Phycisphaeraceae bacterium]
MTKSKAAVPRILEKGASGSYANVGANMRYLNRYMYNRVLDFDQEVLYARCPSDVGTSWSSMKPYFEHAGSSYGHNAHRGYHSLVRYQQSAVVDGKTFSIPIRNTEVLDPSMLVMGAEQGAQNYAWGEFFPQTLSFHSPEPRFSVMFVDSHAAFIEVPKPEAPSQKHTSGPGWTWDEVGRTF